MGWTTAWVSEIDPYASAVLKKHFPDAPNLGDITNIDGTKTPPIDMLVGGFPCQDISLAGKGEGIEGARSGLWKQYARLIDETRPRWVVAENVSALRSRGLDVVLKDLSALGYDAEWHCVPASAVGAPHRRDRIWVVAYPRPLADPDRGFGYHADEAVLPGRDAVDVGGADVADADCFSRHEGRASDSAEGEAGRDAHRSGECAYVSDTIMPGLEGLSRYGPRVNQSRWLCKGPDGPVGAEGLCAGEHAEGWWAVEPDVGRVAHGVPRRVDRLRCLGNAIVPQVAYEIFRAIECFERGL